VRRRIAEAGGQAPGDRGRVEAGEPAEQGAERLGRQLAGAVFEDRLDAGADGARGTAGEELGAHVELVVAPL
jgi:hypothetical protein